MKGYGDSRWDEECFDHCGGCSSCLHSNNISNGTSSIPSKRFVTLGSVRYGVRLGAVSPPPPGAGPRYRSQCCWPSTSNPGFVSRIPLLASPAINSSDIYKRVDRMRMLQDNTSELLDPATIVRDQVVHSSKSLKNQLRRRAVIHPQVSYTRLCDCGNDEQLDILNTLDRLPRFRFGGNRNNSGKERDLDKKSKELRLRELSDRLKKGPTPPLRNKHVLTPENLDSLQGASECNSRSIPLRSVSFSQVDYSTDGKKYIRKKSPQNLHTASPNNIKSETQDDSACELFTFPQHNFRFESTKGPCESTPTEICDNVIVNTESEIKNTATLNQHQQSQRDKSRRRKGMYISQWPNSSNEPENTLQLNCEFPVSESVVEIPRLKISAEKSDSECSYKIDEPDTPDNLSPESEDFPAVEKQTKPPLLLRSDSLTEKTNHGKDQTSDLSDSEAHTPVNKDTLQKRYSKRPLRGPYGQMLEAEMKKPEAGRKLHYNNELKFLETIPGPVSLSSSSSVGAGDPRPKCVIRVRGPSNHSLDDSDLKRFERPESTSNFKTDVSQTSLTEPVQSLTVSHQRTTSSPSKLGFITTPSSPSEVSNELLEVLLSGSSEQLATTEHLQRHNDTRTHVVIELCETEQSYVESLETLVSKYYEPLKSPENVNLIDAALLDEIFSQIPVMLGYHRIFLKELNNRIFNWDPQQKVGDLFLEIITKPAVIETYTNYVNNWKRARDAIKHLQQTKPAFAKFLQNAAREDKGKLALDAFLIKPIQKFPKYELFLQRLLQNSNAEHPDHSLLTAAEREVHEQLLKINGNDREALEQEQLRELELIIDGVIDIVAPYRQYLRHDIVKMTSADGGTRKDRALFLFSDILVVTSCKRRSGANRKTTVTTSTSAPLESNKYKMLKNLNLDCLEIVRSKDESLKDIMIEIENVTADLSVLNQIDELTWSLHCNRTGLSDVIKEMFDKLNKQLTEQQNSDSQLSCLDLTITTSNNSQILSIIFPKPDNRASWEDAFSEAKQKLASSGDRRPPLDLIATVPIRKTRAGLQFTCAAAAIGDNRRDVWVCNSDGYVGQVCVLSLTPDPNVASCNGVCNSRILCITLVPGVSTLQSPHDKDCNSSEPKEEQSSMKFDSSSSSEDDEHSDVEDPIDIGAKISAITKAVDATSIDSEEGDNQQSTMWLGTEDGCIHVYNSNDNIRTKKNKIKLQHGSAVLSIVYLENRVYVSLGNGDIIIYERESSGSWNIVSPTTTSVGTSAMPVSKIVPSSKKLWCACGNTVKVFNTDTLTTEDSIPVNNDVNKPINCIVLSGNALWLSLQNSALVKCFHTLSFELLCEVNVAPAVTKMLTSCDDIIRQHKAACLRVTALLASKDLLWIGTSAGVLLTMSLPHITPTTTKINNIPSVVGVSHGHTGHVRFLTNVEYQVLGNENTHNRNSYKGKPEQRSSVKLLVISGGDGYEDFRSSNISEVAGREDSTNHLLLWNV